MVAKLFLFSLDRMTDAQLVEFSGGFSIDFYGFWIKNVVFAELYNITF